MRNTERCRTPRDSRSAAVSPANSPPPLAIPAKTPTVILHYDRGPLSPPFPSAPSCRRGRAPSGGSKAIWAALERVGLGPQWLSSSRREALPRRIATPAYGISAEHDEQRLGIHPPQYVSSIPATVAFLL